MIDLIESAASNLRRLPLRRRKRPQPPWPRPRPRLRHRDSPSFVRGRPRHPVATGCGIQPIAIRWINPHTRRGMRRNKPKPPLRTTGSTAAVCVIIRAVPRRRGPRRRRAQRQRSIILLSFLRCFAQLWAIPPSMQIKNCKIYSLTTSICLSITCPVNRSIATCTQ